ncbi:DUF2231 domain-containing protein [Nocardia asiatica]|uniref:DUF2231 domain-containing protein n=1 Tax=Nocardia asiatica TaxID=209252 RepID=UPI002453B084|nr:DUF2231 domain-containing protein [Nocardia asiatica]
MNIPRMLRAVEAADRLDRPAARLAASVRRVLGQGRVADWVRGSQLGHPVHPILVTLPIGAWSSAAALRIAGQSDGARRLVLIGLLATPATVAAGLADFGDLDTYQRRVGLVHATANGVAALLFSAAYLTRRDFTATVFGGAGLAAMGVGGALGGHLSYALGAGVHRWQKEAAPLDLSPASVP